MLQRIRRRLILNGSNVMMLATYAVLAATFADLIRYQPLRSDPFQFGASLLLMCGVTLFYFFWPAEPTARIPDPYHSWLQVGIGTLLAMALMVVSRQPVIYIVLMITAQAFMTLPLPRALPFGIVLGGLTLAMLILLGALIDANLIQTIIVGMIFSAACGSAVKGYARQTERAEALLRELQATHAALAEEREKSERLLLNILPETVATRLKEAPHLIADNFAEASVLFADIVDFTPMAEGRAPEEVVSLLNVVFSLFDRLVEERGLEKIKTIGDSYMVAAGLPTPRPDHAAAIADLALAMQRAIGEQDGLGGARLLMRIGINSGQVVAGVIGTKKFIYDLWGDAVNTAARMESHGLPGAIQVTGAVYEHLRDEFVFEPRGMIEVKGKGEVMAYLLTGRRELVGRLPA
ncbi:MAG TPA: adenylate/guanylate cyclase domain-containing protein [Herpetosiphonaceae bacterium]